MVHKNTGLVGYLRVRSLRAQDADLEQVRQEQWWSDPYRKWHTDIEQNSAILLLVYYVGIEDLIVQGLRLFLCGRHGENKELGDL
jgi:hypothetical protein